MSESSEPVSRGGLSFRLGRIPVHMPWSSLAGVAIIAYLWLGRFALDPTDPTQTAVLAILFALLFYVSILGHELAHAYVARACGYPVHSITLWVFGGFTSYERRRSSALREGVIAASGPLSSIAFGLLAAVVAASALATDPRVEAVAYALAVSNVFLGIYNALPGLPLDGGAVLKSVVWGVTGDERRATVVAAWAGRVVAVGIFVFFLWTEMRAGGSPNFGSIAFLGMICAFMYSGASAALRQANLSARVPGLSARALARPSVLVAHDVPLSEALRQADLVGARGLVVIDPAGRPVALARQHAVDAVPLERRPWVPVSSVSATLDPRAILPADLVGEELLGHMQGFPAEDYLVVDPSGALVGVLRTSDVEHALTGTR